MNLLESLKTENDLWAHLGHSNPLKKLIIEKGVTYAGRALPVDIEKGEAKLCFMNALHLSISNPGWKYVEGFGASGSLIEMGIHMPMDHAWCIDENGLLVDNTWDKPETSLYRGIPMDPKVVMKHVLKTGYYGVFQSTGVFDMKMIKKYGG